MFLIGWLTLSLFGICVGSGQALAAPAPVWKAKLQSFPTNLAPGSSGSYQLTVENIGGAPAMSDATAVVTLPPGVTASGAGDPDPAWGTWDCPGAAGSSVVTCRLIVANLYDPNSAGQVAPHVIPPTLSIQVSVDAGASGTAVASATVSGGGASGSGSASAATNITSSSPGFGIAGFAGGAFNTDGTVARQAGAHPDITTEIDFPTSPSRTGGVGVTGNVKDLTIDLPPGLVGNPTATPTCRPALLADQFFGARCPAETQVGTASVLLTYGVFPLPLYSPIPVYNVDPPPGSPARFAFNVTGVVVTIDPTLRNDGTYTIAANVRGSSQTLAVVGTSVTLWGVPADPVHDVLRRNPVSGTFGASNKSTPRPLMTAPTSCSDAPLVTKLRATAWQDPGTVHAASFSTDYNGDPLRTEGCDLVPFAPGFAVRAESSPKRGAPVGLGIDLAVPQNEVPEGLGSAHLKKAVVTLPEGMTVNPSSAQGLEACTPAQIDINGDSHPACPEGSKIGTVDIDTPVLRKPLEGSIYLASQKQNPFGTTLAIYLVAEGSGVVVKLPGRIDPDPVSGRVTATFDNNPQVPFEKVSVHFKTGPRAPLSLPTSCGPATTTAVLTPWSGTAPVRLTSSFDVSQDGNGAACPPMGFAPLFTAGTANPVGGADSAFTLGFSRTDDDQQLSGVKVSMPKGLLARIASTTQCAEGAAAAGTCGEGSRIGSVTTAAGAGSNPFSLPGRVYLTGPYKGAPFGLSIVVPAVAGPFDLGTVVVRAAVSLDPITAQVTVTSDPLPTILEGIPLQVRLVKVDVNRPKFMINPTSCAPSAVDGELKSTGGATAAVSARFQVGDCRALPLKPSLALSLSGKRQTRDGGHPAVSAVLTQPAGQANPKKVRVTLPLSLALDPDNAASDGLCSFVEGSKPDPKCPASSVVGRATAVSPILNQPLSGPVYFVKNERKDPKSGRSIKTTPKLVIPLVGENGLKLTLTGTSTVDDDQLVTTFDNVPDAPVSSFRMDIAGGKKGILVVSNADICAATQVADQQVDGQNNKVADADVYIQTPSCPLKLVSKKVGKTSVAVRVGGLGAGKVTVSGKGIKKTTKTISKSTVATITVRRVSGRLGKAKVTFLAKGAKAAKSTTVTLSR